MKVRTGRCRESELPRVRRECRRMMRPVAAAYNLNRRTAQIAEFRQQRVHLRRVQRIPAGMRKHGGPSAAVNPAYRSAQGRPLVGHIARLATAEKALERSLDVLHDTFPDQKSREMRTPYQTRVGGVLLRAITAAGDAERLERSNDFPGAINSSAAGRCQSGLQCRIGWIDTEADDMDGLALPGHRNLDAVDQPDMVRGGGSACCDQPTRIVVVGQREHSNAALSGAGNQFAGSQSTVRKGGMAVKIQVAQRGLPLSAPIKCVKGL